MTVFNAILNKAFDLLLAPFAGTSPWPGMVAVSALAGILILLIFKYTSNQGALKRKKNRALARILEFLLFKDDLIVTLGAFNRVMVANLKYLGQVLVPLGVSLVPLVLVLVQLNAWFSARALQPGESTVVTVRLRDDLPLMEQEIALKTSDGITVDAGPVRAPEANEISWRIRTKSGSREWVDVVVEHASFRKDVAVGSLVTRVSPSRRQRGAWDQLMNPSEKPLPSDASVVTIDVQHRDMDFALAGIHLHWLLVFFVLSLVSGFIVMKPLGVTV